MGLIALKFPEVLGVGYATMESALLLEFTLWTLIGICVAKVAASAICIGSGFGGGIFSPALVIGAMLGVMLGDFHALQSCCLLYTSDSADE